MSTPLRVGFLVSGILHVAVVAAFSLSSPRSAPVVDAALPITLKLAVFQPAAAAPVIPADPEPARTEPVVEVPPPPVVEQIEPPPAIEPEPLPPAEPVAVQAPRPKPPPAPRQVAASRPVPAKTLPIMTSPVSTPPAAALGLAKVEATEPALPVVDAQVTKHYLAALAARINRSKFYPRASRRLGEEGMVVVSFVIQRNGELTDLSIVESSGHRRLDEAALKTLQRVSPFEKIPEAIDREQWPISVPIAFSLRG